jgi:hypothetical protein
LVFFDRFGVKQLYDTAPSGTKWFGRWDKVRTVGTNEVDTKDARVLATCDVGEDQGFQIGNGIATYVGFDTSPRLYVKGPWLNTEQTVYAKINPGGQMAEFLMRSRSNHHGANLLPYPNLGTTSLGDPISCGFGNYSVVWRTSDMWIELEIIHGLYRRHLVDETFTMPTNQWVGYKVACYNTDSTHIKVEAYNDMTDTQDWTLTAEFTFDGSNAAVDAETIQEHQEYLDYCVDKGDSLGGDINSHQIWNNPSFWNWIRMNDVENISLKSYSIREITPP